MRLLNTRSWRFEEFNDDFKRPPYAILSHRWITGKEASYQDLQRICKRGCLLADQSGNQVAGLKKIMNFRRVARNNGLDWCWADTICIDKTNSVELGEAINSMFDWYQDADECYVYLADIVKTESWRTDRDQSFLSSEWFRRGWTLQEFIAAGSVIFLDASWECLGTKWTLGPLLAEKMGLGMDLLNDPSFFLRILPLADLMALACGRITTRYEDKAYSLMGLFGVSMPSIYGEGWKAFRRLQESIIQHSDDVSLFIHTGSNCLADSVEDFAMHNEPKYLERRRMFSEPYVPTIPPRTGIEMLCERTVARSVTSRGVEMEAAFLEYKVSEEYDGLNKVNLGEFKGRIVILPHANIDLPSLPVLMVVQRSGLFASWDKVDIIADGSNISRQYRMHDYLLPSALPQSILKQVQYLQKHIEEGKRCEAVRYEVMIIR